MQVYHNTIALNDAVATTATAYGIYQTTLATGIDVKNNVIYVTRSGTGIKRCIYFVTATTIFSSNNNVFYMNAGGGTDNKVAQFGTTSYTTLSDWQASNSNAYDQASYELDPIFTNAGSGDFKPTNSVMDSKGTPVGVLKDIIDSTRSTTTPDIGAYEFNSITTGLNFGAVSLVSPAAVTSGCYSSSETVTIQIKNSSANAHNFVTNPVTVTVNVTGAITQTLTTIVNTGTLASDATLNVVLPGSLNMSTVGVYTFNANTTLTGDVNTANDAIIATNRTKIIFAVGTAAASPNTFCAVAGTLPTLSIVGFTGASSLQWQESSTASTGFADISGATTPSFTVINPITQNRFYRLVATCAGSSVISTEATVSFSNPTILTTTPATRCGTGTVNLGATASAGATVNWYTAASGGTSLFTGTTFTTPSIAANTTYFAEAATGSGTQNVATPTAGTSTFFSSSTGWGLRFTVNNTVTINSVKIYASNATAGAASMQIKITDLTDAVLYTGILHNFSVGTTLAEYTVPVGITIPPGSNYKMVMTSTGISALVRESGGVTFPYNSPSSSVSITAGSNGVTTAQTTASYYWFYAWVISEGCNSTRTAVVATVDNSPGCVTVPVTLSNFSGEKMGTTNKLIWTTATEINNDGFELQRSADGINFSKLVYVASKAFNGTSAQPINYSFSDIKTLAGNNYYRLKQIDKDGRSTYSTIVLLKGNKVNTLSISSVYPNPVINKLNVVITAPNNDFVTLIMTDIRGKIILQKQLNITIGDNLQVLNLDQIAKGTYLLKLICSNGCETSIEKIIK